MPRRDRSTANGLVRRRQITRSDDHTGRTEEKVTVKAAIIRRAIHSTRRTIGIIRTVGKTVRSIRRTVHTVRRTAVTPTGNATATVAAGGWADGAGPVADDSTRSV